MEFDIKNVRINIKELYAESRILKNGIKTFTGAVTAAGWASDKIINKQNVHFGKSPHASCDYKAFKKLKLRASEESMVRNITIGLVKKYRKQIVKLAKYILTKKKVNFIFVRGNDIIANIENNSGNLRVDIECSSVVNAKFELLKNIYDMDEILRNDLV
jgi:hypothetical protein